MRTARSPTSARSPPPTPTPCARFHAGQSDESIYLRFFAPMRTLSDRDVHRFTHVDYVDRVALIVAHAGRHHRGRPLRPHRRAQRRGRVQHQRPLPGQGHRLGPARAPRRGRPGDRASRSSPPRCCRRTARCSRSSRTPATRCPGGSRTGSSRSSSRSSRPTAPVTSRCPGSTVPRRSASGRSSIRGSSPSSGRAVGRTRSVAGSSQDLVDAGFTGAIHPVNPNADEIAGRPAYAAVADIPEQVDLAVVVVPCRPRPRRRRRLRQGGREVASRRDGRLRRVGPGRRQAPGQARQAGPPRGHAGGRARTPSASSTTTPRSGSTRRCRRSCPRRATSPSSRSPAPSGSPSSPRRRAGGSGSRRSPRPATGSTCPRTTSCSTGSTTTTPRAVGLYLESMGNPRKFSRIARNLAVDQADHRRQVGGLRLRRPTGPPGPADQGPARGLRLDAAPVRCHPGRERPPALRRRLARRQPAAAQGRTGRPRRQRGRARRDHRRRLPQLGPHRQPRSGVHAGRRDRPRSSASGSRRPSPTRRSTPSSPASSHRSSPSTRRSPTRSARPPGARTSRPRHLPRHARRRRRPLLGPRDRRGPLACRSPSTGMPEDAVRALAAATKYARVAVARPRHPGRPGRHQPADRRGHRRDGPLRSTRTAAGSRPTRRPPCSGPTASRCGRPTRSAASRRPSSPRRRSATPSS